jgi:meso-butanediol dehydrogenase/(S,S)-butanediol dehydrogenase/diacetyl reductase
MGNDTMEQRLSRKTAIVTGAGRGIGKAVALRLAREGANIVVADINPKTAEQTAEEIQRLNRRALACQIDVANVAEIQPIIDHTVAVFERIDILVNAAGVAQTGLFLELTEQQWDHVLDTNLKSTTFIIQAVARQMIRQIPEKANTTGDKDSSPLGNTLQSNGKIVNFSSISGRHGRAEQIPYAASKAAIISITQSAALAFARYNINVNAVCPGVVPTPMWEQIDQDRGRISGLAPGESIKSFIERIPLKRPGSTEDVAVAVAFLCSPDSDYMTGQTLNVDGGFEMD